MNNDIVTVVLHYGKSEDTRTCLQSLVKGGSGEVVLISNTGLTDKEIAEYHKLNCRDVTVNAKNLGFSEGNNVGIRKALTGTKAGYVMLLNNDTVIPADFFARLKSFLAGNRSVQIFSPKIYFEKGHEYHKQRYGIHDSGKVIWFAGGVIDWANMYVSHRGVDEVDRGQYEHTEITEFATGCCMVIGRSVFEKVGFFDPRYFVYFEDVDFSRRALKAGFSSYYNPVAHLWHKNAASSGKPGSLLHNYYLTRNRLYFGMKYAPLSTRRALVFESVRRLVYSPGNIQSTAVKDYFLGKMGYKDL